MWISEIIIKNFRNYQGVVKFNLDKKITILYGDNGFGKSSFFDAIEWGLTGSISRFERNDNDSEFRNEDLIYEEALKEDESECSVTLKFGNHTLKRYFTSHLGITNKIYVDLSTITESKDGKLTHNVHGKVNVEQKLRKIFVPNLNDSNLYIKQPFILSQDQVTDFVVKDKPKDRYKALANMVGLNNIINYSENLRRIIKELNVKSKEFDTVIIKNQGIIDSYTPKENIQFNEIFSRATDILELTIETEENFQEIITKNKSARSAEIFKFEKQIELLNKIMLGNYSTFKELLNIKGNYSKSSMRLENHIQFVKNSVNSLNLKLISLDKDKDNKQLLIEQTEQQNILKSNIEGKKNSLSLLQLKPMIDSENIDNKIEEVSNSIEILNYAISYWESYNNLISENKKNPIKLSQTYDIIKSLNRKVIRKDIWNKRLSEWLLSKSEDSGELKLLELLKGVTEYIQITNENKICPVCSTDKEGELLSIAKINLSNKTILLQQQSEKVKKVLDIKNNLDNLIFNIKKDLEDNKIITNDLIRTKERNQEQIERISTNQLFSFSLFTLEIAKLKEDEIIIGQTYKDLNEAKIIFVELKELDRRNKSLQERIVDLQGLIKSDNQEIIKNCRSKISKREILLKDYEKALINTKNGFDKINLDINMLLEHGILEDGDLFSEKIKKIIEESDRLKASVGILDDIIIQYSDFKGLNIIKEKVGNSLKEKKEASEKLAYITSCVEVINSHIEEMNQKIGTEAIEFLNKETSGVQQYYRYLNPMVSSKRLKFITNDEELIIKVAGDYVNESSARFVLSSGQMNVLALSIFLSINEAMDSKLDFVAIDDPIQNMDDVNQFSVCDILSNIKRQIIFSTHDMDFLKLFIKKNEHLNGEIQVYMLKKPVISENDSIEHILFGA